MKTRPIQQIVALMFCLPVLAGCGLRNDRPDGSGTIECTQVQVSPQVAGRIMEFAWQEGDAVPKGAVVAKLDPADYELKCNEARAALAQVQAQRDLMLAGARDEDIQRAREQVREAEAAARAAQADFERIRQVFEKKSATQKQMDDARAGNDRAAAVLAAAQQALEKLVRGNRQEEIRAAQAAVDLAQARLAQTEKTLSDCSVIAPMDGVVTTKIREEGEVVGPGAALLTLSRLDEVWLSVYVPETRLGGVKLGQAARVRIDGDAREYDGKVTYISPEAEFTPKNVQTPEERVKLVYRVKITLPNPDGVFKPGMPADGYLGAVP
ncbi:MAG: efflux RND transporter periplasmic adaptor subunit [Verrucomicrobia bacterium]|nr:efflux RND transporter periplasmic adaptor subunit [Verrucomicrobiota bacterium]